MPPHNLAWAVGCNGIALPLAAGIFEPLGIVLRPEIAAISMSGSSLLVAVNALLLRQLRLPGADDHRSAGKASASGELRSQEAL